MSSYPRITIVTTPIRPNPTAHPPIGSLCVVSALRRSGVGEVEFYDIDGLRPTYEEVLEHFRMTRPDILGISAIVSTSYQYSKRLSQDVKKILPNTMIVLGGNLAAASEIVLRKTGVDICCTGEGEKTMSALVKLYSDCGGLDKKKLADTPGVAYLDGDVLRVNDFEEKLSNEEMLDIDWSIVDEAGIRDVLYKNTTDQLTQFAHDPRFYDPHRRGKYHGRFFSSKGCVAKCTFCHRFTKGIRYMPLGTLKKRLEDFISRFNIGFLSWNDENFGIHDRWLEPFCKMMKELDVLWNVSGVRVKQITPDKLKMMHDAGCIRLAYGMETGSEAMLKVMEKKVNLEDNYNAARWTAEEKIPSGIALVIGMPGETHDTIRETKKFCRISTAFETASPVDSTAYYAQALPGTPLYEIARHKGIIGTSWDEEEKYLLDISDKNASYADSTLNFTDYPRVVVEAWAWQIMFSNLYHYQKRFGVKHYSQQMLKSLTGGMCVMDNDTNYFVNVDRILGTGLRWSDIDEATRRADMENFKIPSFWHLVLTGNRGQAIYFAPRLTYYLSGLIPIMFIVKSFRSSAPHAWRDLGDYVKYLIKRPFKKISPSVPCQSLRKTVNEINENNPIRTDNSHMVKLRKGM